MRILAVADEESKSLWDFYLPEKLEGIDLIISCGDLHAEYLEFLATMVKCPILYVPGNHDERYVKEPPGGCECIDGKIYTFNGVRIFGLGGAMKYKRGPYMYSERDMRHRIWFRKFDIIMKSGIDILVTHAPVRGYGDLEDLPHKGYECFDQLIKCCRPKYMLHGHVHAGYGSKFKRIIEHPCGTKIINAYDKYIFDIDTENRNEIKRSELFGNMFFKFI
jgi:Icc-related predicted phosphoesterase